MAENPIIWSDYPDADVIRVEDTYYMISTTMHFMPGAVILRSFDLCRWEIASYVYDRLDSTKAQTLADRTGIYGKGMWAASLRFCRGIFYVCFSANDTKKTYLYQAEDLCGPWKKQYIEGFYHDPSLLFDDDGRIYIMYGNRQIFLTELKPDLSGPLERGLHRMILEDGVEYKLGCEGTHFYKINGKYYAFFIHWPAGADSRRTQACFAADSLEGEFKGGDILDDDFGGINSGTAQGGIVCTPEGKWYGMFFQDRGAVGRCPILVPMHFENDFPVPDDPKVPSQVHIKSTRPDYVYRPLQEGDDFFYEADREGKIRLKKVWQWNHEPDGRLWSVTRRPGHLIIWTDCVSINVTKAKNILTQRMAGPVCMAQVQVDAGGLKEGDYAGICAFQSFYGFLAVCRKQSAYEIVLLERSAPLTDGETGMGGQDGMPPQECARVKAGRRAQLRIVCDFRKGRDEAFFFYKTDREWKKIGGLLKMAYTLDHFAGYRFGLAYYSSKTAGGCADFSKFRIDAVKPEAERLPKHEGGILNG